MGIVKTGIYRAIGGGPRRAATVSLLSLCCMFEGVVAATVTEEAFFDDLPSVVTVTRLAQNALEVPAAVTVIDRAMIDASGAVDIPELLRLVAGFQVGHPYATRIAVTYHGMTGEYASRMQVLVDGRSVYSPVFGGVEWPLLPLSMEDIERIEVTRGPNGVSYGANSYLGVINIITTHPAEIADEAYVKAVADTGGEFQKAVLRQGGTNGDFNYYLTLEHRWDAGLDDSAPNGNAQEFDEFRVNLARFRGEYRAGINDYLDIQLGMNNAQLGAGKENEPTSQVRMTDNLAHFQQLGWRHLGGTEQETQLLFTHDYNDLQDAYNTSSLSDIFNVDPNVVEALLGVPDQPLAVNLSRTSERYNLELQHRYRISANLRAVSGAEVRLDRIDAPGILVEGNWLDTYLYRVFSNAEWRATPNLHLNGGAMVELTEGDEPLISPRVAANYLFTKAHAIRLSYTRAYRTPAANEQHAYIASYFANDGGVIDEIVKSRGDLRPERMDAWEIGLVGSHDNGVSYDLKLFSEKMTELITLAGEDNLSEPYCSIALLVNYQDFCRADYYSNAGHGVTTGAELQFSYRPNSQRRISLAWSHLFKREGEVLFAKYKQGDIYGSMETWRPEDTVTLMAEQEISHGIALSGMLHHVDSWLSVGNTNDVRFTTANARLSKRFSTGGIKGSLAFGVNAILGSYYDFYYFSPTTPRSYLSLDVVF